ncbi:helix-turn-helix domain-containing protein [Parafilimonas terrae]|jgi:excisionase family DNA binding protein|uniref:DNA binding domain-containing protein, excisionase family n=1 Tax=Parafilimonas terrae TaxID=1465490 RepID=A0A1I5R7R3_9BACT|nr:helix-turn-helix domain-containing protein [Parafilimonas terrae]SFP54578.1 DNA binding domain-containing protein, excisionase family [Parafilimonas terrae]
MERNVQNEPAVTPMLFPYEPAYFWRQIREIIKEEVSNANKAAKPPEYQTSGLTYKPLYKTQEVCQILQVTRPTIYDWIRHGKLKPCKIRSRVYFRWKDLQELLQL